MTRYVLKTLEEFMEDFNQVTGAEENRVKITGRNSRVVALTPQIKADTDIKMRGIMTVGSQGDRITTLYLFDYLKGNDRRLTKSRSKVGHILEDTVDGRRRLKFVPQTAITHRNYFMIGLEDSEGIVDLKRNFGNRQYGPTANPTIQLFMKAKSFRRRTAFRVKPVDLFYRAEE